MARSSKARAAALALAGAALLAGATPAAAVAPAEESWTVHVERPFVDCSGFTVVGIWDISHRLTFFHDASGVAVRDIERVDFAGRLTNPESGAWVADRGTRIFFDTLAPDGSYLTTYMVQVRKSDYVHVAGRTDFQTGAFSGSDGLDSAGMADLCEALGG